MSQRRRSTLGKALGDLLNDRSVGGLTVYAARVGCHRSSLSRALCDPHRRGNGLVECVCALLWALRAEGQRPRALLDQPFPSERLVAAGVSGATDVARAFTFLFPEGYETVVAARLRMSKDGLRRAVALPEGRVYPHLQIIAQLLINLRDLGHDPLISLDFRVPPDFDQDQDQGHPAGEFDGRLPLAL